MQRDCKVISIDQALADAGRLRAAFVGEAGYGLAYGSHASRPAVTNSDLDLLFVGPVLHHDQLDELVCAVETLHHDHGLPLDTEVPYEVKLHANVAHVEAALMLRGFTVSQTGEVHVPPLVVEPWFLHSTPFKLRLILNALTTPHVFVGGDIDLYQRHCACADRTVALLALSLLDSAADFTVTDVAAALVEGPDGATGKDFLGYAHGPDLHSTLQRGLAHLVREQAVPAVDGASFEQHRDVRRKLIGAACPPAPRRSTEPGTMAPRKGMQD